jgi:predicted transcriptional regulator
MRRGIIEMHIDILKALAHRGPLRLTHLMYRVNINGSVLKEYLGSLVKQNLIEQRTVGKRRVVYAITQRGITVLKYFRELEAAGNMPLHVPFVIIEEDRNERRMGRENG